MAYSGIRAVTLAWKTMISRQAISARAMMPREKTSRLPRIGQLARQEAVAGVQRAQAREVGEGGVGRHDQDERRRRRSVARYSTLRPP